MTLPLRDSLDAVTRPAGLHTEEALDTALSEPRRAATVAALARAPGDIIVLGAGGKMGPTLTRMARRAAPDRRVIAVSRFTAGPAEEMLRAAGVETIRCDLLDRAAVAALPDAPNVIFMAGQKFGTADAPHRTWMMNVVVPALCAERFATSRIVAFSTGNVYPLVPADSGGAREDGPLGPVGEYAASCVGRERVLQHAAETRGTPIAIVRLNYAAELRYGVLTDLALKVWREQPIAMRMGSVNVIWQRDANAMALELLPLATTPPMVVNITGAAALSVRWLATELGKRLERTPRFEGTEAPDALLSNTARMRALLGEPDTRIETMLDLVANWVKDDGPLLGKDTHYATRDGVF